MCSHPFQLHSIQIPSVEVVVFVCLNFRRCQHTARKSHEINVHFVYEFKKRLYHIRNASSTMTYLVNLVEETRATIDNATAPKNK